MSGPWRDSRPKASSTPTPRATISPRAAYRRRRSPPWQRCRGWRRRPASVLTRPRRPYLPVRLTPRSSASSRAHRAPPPGSRTADSPRRRARRPWTAAAWPSATPSPSSPAARGWSSSACSAVPSSMPSRRPTSPSRPSSPLFGRQTPVSPSCRSMRSPSSSTPGRMWQRWHDHRVADDVGILLEVVDLLGDDPFQLVFLDGHLAILHPHHIRVVHGVH